MLIPFQSHSAAQKGQFPVFGTRVVPKHRLPVGIWEFGNENITNRKPLKSYANPPKIIGLLLILHEQFKFYVTQHGRALVPCRLVWGQIRPQNRIPHTQISLHPKFQVNPTSTFREITISISVLTIFSENCLFLFQNANKFLPQLPKPFP